MVCVNTCVNSAMISIAAAVEEQSVTVTEISNNINESADKTNVIAQEIADSSGEIDSFSSHLSAIKNNTELLQSMLEENNRHSAAVVENVKAIERRGLMSRIRV